MFLIIAQGMERQPDIRWKQRYENFNRALGRLNETAHLDLAKLSLLEKEGMIQRFEYTLELAWKTLKDKMEFDGLLIDRISPKMVIKEAFRAQYIDDITTWFDMISDRNALSHRYDFSALEEILPEIQRRYIPFLHQFSQNLAHE